MKKVTLTLLALILVQALAMAQYTGGIGRGDFKLDYAFPVIVSNAHASSNGGYASLKLAFDAINDQVQTGFNINVTIVDNTTETASAVLNAGLWTTLSIYPTVTGLSITGNLDVPLIDLNGADNVTIDGRVNQAGDKSLIITNASTSATDGTSTIRFINDAISNTVKYCNLKGSSVASAGGILFFSTTTGNTGNDGNTIDNNNITSASDVNRIYNAIYSAGTSATTENSGNIISNNNFYNYCSRAGSSMGINLYSNTTNWTITANSFYETASFVTTLTGNYGFIYITAGNNYSITSNYIGGNGPAGSGTWIKTGNTSGTIFGIYLSTTAGTASEIQGNVIRNFSWTGSSGWFYGIRAEGEGSVNIGTSAGNTIGAASGNDSFVWTATTNYDNLYGLYLNNTGTIVAEHNIVGALTANNTAAYATCIYGIYKNGSGTTTINANTIGSTDAATTNSIYASSPSTGASQTVYGIYSAGSGTVSITGNTVSKLSNGTTNTDISTAGLINGITATGGINDISGNTVRDLTIANANTAAIYTASVTGIALNYTTASVQSITGNTIYNLSNTYASFGGNVIGLYYNGSTTTSTVSKNFIHSLSVTGASSTAAYIYGIKIYNGSTTWSNNIISLGSNLSTNIYGIYERGDVGNDNSLYYNTIYISGDMGAGTAKSYALFSATSTNSRDFRNNIFDNQRFQGAKSPSAVYLNYAVWFDYAVSTNLTLDNNDYYVKAMGSGALGYFNATDVTSLPLISGKDANSKSVSPGFASAGGTSAANYLPSNTTFIAATGTGITTDYDNHDRSATYPAMGALEYNVTPPCVNPTSGGTIAENQTGCTPFVPALLTNTTSPSGHNGTLEYKWQYSVTSSSDGFTDVSTGTYTATTYSPETLTVSTWYKRLSKVTCAGTWTITAESNVVTMTVNPLLPASVIIAAVPSGAIWAGTSVTFTATPTNGGAAPAYKWYNGGTEIEGETGATYTSSALSNGNTITVVMTSNATPCLTGSPATSNVVSITVTVVPVVVTASSGTTDPTNYSTVKAAFDAINLGTHKGDITIKINASTTETDAAVLYASGSAKKTPANGGPDYTSVNVYPTVTGLSINGNLASPLIDLDGADNVTINGSLNGLNAGKDLTITNTSTSTTVGTSTIRFIGDASNNTVKYCTLKGSQMVQNIPGYGSGIVFFSTGTTTGNDGNLIDHNNITNAADVNRPVNAIFSLGTSAMENSGNTMSYNNIYDFLIRDASFTTGICVRDNNTNWTISGNNFYESASFAATGSESYYFIIYLESGSGHTIASNYIGGSSAACSGTWTKTGNFQHEFIGICINSSSTGNASEIQGNIIRNINWTSGSGSFTGIKVAGSIGANIGTITPNVVGTATGNGAITYTLNTTNTAPTCYGITTTSTGTVWIQNNTVGAITTNNSNTGYPANFYGIHSSGTGGRVINTNTIGSTAVATTNSIYASSPSTGASQTVYGIYSEGSGNTMIIANTVSKLTNGTTNATAGTAGLINGITAANGTNTISGNTVRDLTIANANTSAFNTASVTGIALNYTTAATQSITGNIIYNLSNSYASFEGNVIGLYYNGSTTSSAVSENFIHSLSLNSANTAASIYGIKIDGGSASFSNNIISLGTGITTGYYIYGIKLLSEGTNTLDLFYNTVYIGGTASGATSNSYALSNSNGGSNFRTYKNNIFSNSRAGGSGGKHYAVSVAVLTNLIIDYNDYYAPNGVLGYLGADITTLAAWRAATGQDIHSLNINPVFATPGGTLAANYLPSESSLVAVTGTGITTDYAGIITRSATSPAMGAWEYSVSQAVSITATSGTLTGVYPTLKDAFDAINAGTHKGEITIKINSSTTETSKAVLYASGFIPGKAPTLEPSNYTSVIIYPTASGLSVSGNLATPLIDLNGADNVTIDGRVNATGSTKDLVISNASITTSVTGGVSAIRFINDASSNTVKYCAIKGSSLSTNSGIIYFSTTSGSTGNDDNTIDNNDITSATDANRPVNAIYSKGTVGLENGGNIITNNNIYNFLNRGWGSQGINLSDNTTSCTISGNSFYETATFVPTADVTYKLIMISNEGVNFTISNNLIGGSLPACSGTWTKTNAYNNDFFAIAMVVGNSAVSNIQGNTIKNFSWSDAPGKLLWCGIAGQGKLNIGTLVGNTIGGSTGTGSITYTGESEINGSFNGIILSGAEPIDIQNNMIGSITVAGSNDATGIDFFGIGNMADGTITISNNTIGSLTTANSINLTSPSTTWPQKAFGIFNYGTGSVTISGNTIANMKNGTTNSSTGARGLIQGIAALDGTNIISGNTIRDLIITNANNNAFDLVSAAGIVVTVTTVAVQSITGNTIYNLRNTGGHGSVNVIGLYYNGSTTSSAISGNFIHGLSVSTPGKSPVTEAAGSVYGIKINAGSATYSNNIISLGCNTPITLYGIYETGEAGNDNNLYYNTIYIYGNVASFVTKSYALYSATSTNTRNFRNNIFYNQRSSSLKSPGFLATNYAAWFDYDVSTNLTLDNNDYYAPGNGGALGYYNSAVVPALPLIAGMDGHSTAIDPLFASAGGSSAANYLPSATSLVAVTGTGITTDYDGHDRSETYPAMGAWEYTVSPPCANPTSGGAIADNQTGCSPFDPALLTNITSPSGHNGTLEYKWQYSTTSSSSGFTDIASSNAATYDPPAGLTENTWYMRLARVTCSSDWTGAKASNVIAVTVNPLLPVSVSVEPSANPSCSTDMVTFTATPTNGGPAPSYQWKVNGTNVGTNNPVYAYAPANNDVIACVLTSSETLCVTGNPANSNVVTMAVYPYLPVNVSITESINSVCAGTNVSFTATPTNGGPAPSYQWKVNGANVGDNNPVFEYSPANNDGITCVMTSNAPCTISNPVTSNVVIMAVNPLLPVRVSITESINSVCAGTTVTFTATPTNGGLAPSYQWKVNVTNVGTDNPEYSYTPTNGDNVTCVLTSNEACTTGNPATSNMVTMAVNPLLPVGVSILSSNNYVCAGFVVTFTATPTNGGPGPSYQWKVNGTNVGDNNPVFEYAPANGDVITCVLNSNETCNSGNPATSNSIVMTIYPRMPVSITISPAANPVCINTPVTFIATPVWGGNNPRFQWKVNGIDAGTNNNAYTYTPVNNDVIVCILSSNEECTSNNPATSNNVIMTVSPMLPVSVSVVASANPVCAGTTITFTASPINGGTTPSYQWKVNGINVGIGQIDYSYAPANNDVINCVLTSDAACTTGSPAISNSLVMTVNPNYPVSVSIVPSANQVCSGTSVTFTASPTNGGSSPSYQWIKNGSNVGNNNPVYSYVPENNDVITCVLTSSETGCITGSPATSNSFTMIVNPAVAVSVTIAASQNNVCTGTSVTFTATPVGGGTPTYQWFKNTIAVGTGETYACVPVNGDVVKVVMTSSLSCSTGSPATSNQITMVVNPAVAVSVTISASQNNVCTGTSVTFTATPVGGGTPTYQWFKNTVAVGTGTTYSCVPVNGDVVKVVMTSSLSCSTGSPATSNSVTMVVNPIPAAPVITLSGNTLMSSATSGNQWYFEGGPISGATGQTHVATLSGWYWSVVTLNGCSSDTSNHVHVIITGMLELPELIFTVYPIPNDGRFTASITSAFRQIFSIQIFNKIGQAIYEMSDIRVNGKYEQLFDLRPIPTGIYTVVLRNQEGVIIRKIIITK